MSDGPQRVLFVVRPNAGVQGGGDLTQMTFAKRGLEAAGIEVDVVSALEPDPRGYDLAHIFGAFDPEICAVQMTACKAADIPVALSPIWWDLYTFFARSKVCERILAGPKHRIETRLARLRATPTRRVMRWREGRKYAVRIEWQRALLRQADVLLPNSAIEAHYYLGQLGLYDRPIVIVPNPVDLPDRQLWSAQRSGVACVGRIEPKKNQAMLLYALRELDVELTLVGGCCEPEYIALCRRWLGPRVRLTGDLPHAEVMQLLGSAAVHVLPSWAEWPGIANLEAAAAGAHLVASDRGTEVEYLGEHARYVDPEDPAGIRAAVERALREPPRTYGDALFERLRAFSVDAVGRRTLDGYALASGAAPR